MKGLIRKLIAGSCLSAGALALTGCACYRDIVDPCWPKRYSAMAAQSVRDMRMAQSERGHVLDQTIWNWQFEPDPKTGGPTATLNGAGMETLRIISRRPPVPDFQLYLQNAQDLRYSAALAPEKLVAERGKLNEKRAESVQRFLATQAPLNGGNAYHVSVHDLAPPNNPADWNDKAQILFQKNLLSGTVQNFTLPRIN